MKRMLALALCCMLLSGCSGKSPEPTQAPTPEPDVPAVETAAPTQTDPVEETQAPTEALPTETAALATVTYELYLPNVNADGFDIVTVETDRITADGVLAQLHERGALPEDVVINAFGADGDQLNLDFNQAFADLVCSMGTSGERMVIGSVVNTFLNAFQAQSVYFTVDGEVLESGHVVYDFPIEFVN